MKSEGQSSDRETSGIPHPASTHADSVVAIHLENENRAGRHQRTVETVTAWIGRPFLLYGVVIISSVWVFCGLVARSLGVHFFDRPPFPVLELASTMGGLFVATAVLITQNRQAKTQQRQVQLDLQISLLIDQKSTKIIKLLEELRRDDPDIRNRFDKDAHDLSKEIDPKNLAADLNEKIEMSETLDGMGDLSGNS